MNGPAVRDPASGGARAGPLFSVVTPVFNGLPWLPLCVASVADQDWPVEHLIQDGGSTDGTAEWLGARPALGAVSGRDRGMYDAINRGLQRARGEFAAYLNCDEQYLPGALAAVAAEFRRRPGTEVLFADAVVVDRDGGFIAYRKALPPRSLHVRLSGNAGVLTCATFFRRSVFEARGIRFDAGWRTLGDAAWLLELIRSGVRMGVLRRFTSVFTETGANLGTGAANLAELARLRASVPGWLRAATPLLVAHHRLRRLLHGLYFQRPFSYRLYTLQSPAARVCFEVRRPVSRWRR